MATRGAVWAIDAEWGFRDRRIDEESAWQPVVLCVVALHTGARHHFLGRAPRLQEFFRAHSDDLFVAHYAIAEIKYLLRLGIPLPARWFDTFVAWRCGTNGPVNLEAGLTAALRSVGLPYLAPATKKDLRRKISHLDFDAEDQDRIVDYCFSDCDACLALLSRIEYEKLDEKMAHWAEFLKAVARMELRGIPFTMHHTSVCGHNAWGFVRH